jgi:MmyB-like transcription regulator ligand binding domain
MRELYVDWKTKAQDAVAYLRLASGQHPDDPRIATLIGDLSVNSPEFAKLWTGHAVRQCRSSVRGLRHPLIGGLALNEEVMELVQDAGQRMVLYSADPDSPAGAALRLLAGITAEQARSEQARHCVAAPARAQ